MKKLVLLFIIGVLITASCSNDSEADLITITHDAHNRKGFALGAVLAAEWAKNQQGLLTIQDYYKDVYGF